MSYQGKLMRDPAIWWKLCSEAQGGKHLITVVVLDDLAHRSKGHGIGILVVRAQVVQ